MTEAELAEAEARVEGSVKEAIAVSLANIHYFSDRSRRQDWSGVNAQGVEVAERFLPCLLYTSTCVVYRVSGEENIDFSSGKSSCL